MPNIEILIKRLYLNKIIIHRISDLNNHISQQNNENFHINISLEKDNHSRDFCYLTLNEITIVYQQSIAYERCLYELILSTSVSVISCFFMTLTLVLYVYVYIYIDMYPYSSFSLYSLVILFRSLSCRSLYTSSDRGCLMITPWRHYCVFVFLFCVIYIFYIYSVVFPWILSHSSMFYPGLVCV